MALVPARWFIGVLLFLDLTNHQLKSFGDILIVPGACFCVGAVKLFSQSFAILNGDLTLVRTQITFVSDDDNRNPFRALRRSVHRRGLELHVMIDRAQRTK
jgi:hypothetical protein